MKIRGARVVILLLSILTIFIGCDMESVKEKPLEENKSSEERVALDESAEVEDSVMVEDSQTEEKIVRVEEKANNEEDIVNTDTKRNVVESEEIINDYDNFTYIDYYNQRFGYTIKYPSFLTNKFGASNNDGITAEK
jgi:ABC-type Zn2+ transport system substrate-binding protein/surface adhesin